MFRSLFSNNVKEEINSFKTLMLTLAGRIGVGSISGIALAIYIGGPGTLFWIWFISLISIPIVYAETFLGIKYRENNNGEFTGGPAYYIKNGLKKYKLGSIYSLIIIIAYIIGFVSIQSNTITKSLTSILNIRPVMIGMILGIITSMVIFGGIKKIIDVTGKIVPIMTIIYVGLAILIVVNNIRMIPVILKLIIDSALNYKAFDIGFLTTMLIGIQRGIFSNEAGIGTGSIAASVCENEDSVCQGYVQMLSVYITSFLICSATGIIIILSNYGTFNIADVNGIEIAMNAFNYHFGNIGNIILIILIFLFAFSTILSGYYYGESSLKYFNNKNNNYVYILRIILILIVFLGSIFSSTIIWKFIDIFVAILIIINIYAIYKLRNKIRT